MMSSEAPAKHFLWRKRSTLPSGDAFTFCFDDVVVHPSEVDDDKYFLDKTHDEGNKPTTEKTKKALSEDVRAIWDEVQTVAERFYKRGTKRSAQEHESDWNSMRKSVRMKS